MDIYRKHESSHLLKDVVFGVCLLSLLCLLYSCRAFYLFFSLFFFSSSFFALFVPVHYLLVGFMCAWLGCEWSLMCLLIIVQLVC